MSIKKEFALVLGGTENIAYAVYVTVASFLENNRNIFNNFDIVIYNDDWGGGVKKPFFELCGNVRFIRYTRKDFIKKLGFDINNDSWAARTFTYMVYSKFELFSMLNDYKNVLWLDSDIYVTGCIKKIFNFSPIALTLIPSPLSKMFYNAPNYDDIPAYNGGVILLSDSLNYHKLTENCYQLLKVNFDNVKLPDQAIMSLLFFQNKIVVNNLPIQYNDSLAELINDKVSKSVVIHFNRKYAKLWNNPLSRLLFSKYDPILSNFLIGAGLDVKNTHENYFTDYLGDTLKATLVKLEYQSYWKYIFSIISPNIHSNYFLDVFWSQDRCYVINKNFLNDKKIWIQRSPFMLCFICDRSDVFEVNRLLTSIKFVTENLGNQIVYKININLFNYANDINNLITLFEPFIFKYFTFNSVKTIGYLNKKRNILTYALTRIKSSLYYSDFSCHILSELSKLKKYYKTDEQ